VATDHWHFDVRGAFAGDLCHEFVGAHLKNVDVGTAGSNG
jgi:hypothetical protein